MHKKRVWKKVHEKLLQTHKKCVMKMKVELEEKNDGRLKYFCWKERVYKARTENSCMDIKQLQVNDSWYIEGTICLVNEWMDAKGMVFRAWAHERRHKTRNGWYSILVGPNSSIVGLLILYKL